MNWLERYTFAVKSHLPAGVRQDVADELLSDLEDERDHRAESLGRDLTEAEVKTLLTERGHPLLVAARFQPRPTLVSEELYPLYLLMLRWVVLAIALAQVVMAIITGLNQADPHIWQLIPQLLWNILQGSLYGFAWLTLAFYLIGESIQFTDLFKHWKPESLPQVTAQGEYISRTGSAFEVVFMVYFAAWLNRIIPQSLGDNAVEFVFSDQWPALLPWINAIILASIVISVSKLLFPYWTRRKIVIDLLLYIPAIALLAVIYQWDSPLAIRIGTGEHARQWDISSHTISLVMLGYLIFAAVDAVIKLRKFRAIGH